MATVQSRFEPNRKYVGVLWRDWKEVIPKSRENILQTVEGRWNTFRGRNICEELVNSMPKRLQVVIDSLGAYTKY
jgi:hypothetical protein